MSFIITVERTYTTTYEVDGRLKNYINSNMEFKDNPNVDDLIDRLSELELEQMDTSGLEIVKIEKV